MSGKFFSKFDSEYFLFFIFLKYLLLLLLIMIYVPKMTLLEKSKICRTFRAVGHLGTLQSWTLTNQLIVPAVRIRLISNMVGCFRFKGPLRQYCSLHQTVSQRERKKWEMIDQRKMSKQTPPAPTPGAISPCPTVIQIRRTPWHWRLPRTIAPPDHPNYQ